MKKSDVIKLLAITRTQDSNGVFASLETEKQVYCTVTSVTAAEFHAGGQNGLKPALRFTIFAPEYDNEETILYNDERYSVYRTYLDNDRIELYTQKVI